MMDIGKRLRIVLGALALAFAALAATLQAAPEVYVASAGDHSTGAGWSTAFTNVQAAIDAVDDGGTIHLKGETFTITNQLTWIGGADVTLRGGSNARGAGIHTDSASSFSLRNTLFHGNIASGSATFGGAICHYTGNNLTIDNCTFADNAPTAIDRQNVNGSIELNNCILWGNGEREIIDRGASLKTTAYHCDIRDGFNNGTNNCFARDPRFMRPAAAQYQLRTHSPCREQGKALSWHTADGVDLAGNPRILPTKGIVDLGALEGLPLQATWLILR